MGARVYGVRARVYGVGARVYGAGARVYGSLVILVSAQVLLVLTLGLLTSDLGLTISMISESCKNSVGEVPVEQENSCLSSCYISSLSFGHRPSVHCPHGRRSGAICCNFHLLPSVFRSQ